MSGIPLYSAEGITNTGEKFVYDDLAGISLVDAETHGRAPGLLQLPNGRSVLMVSAVNIATALLRRTA